MARGDNLNLEDIDDNDPQAPSQLRQFAERMQAEAAGAKALVRENAALKLGIDTSTRLGQAWLASTTVDLTDRDAALADAKEFSPTILRADPEAPALNADGTPVVEGAPAAPAPSGSAERQALADGALPSGAAIPDVATSSMENARETLKAGGTMEDALGGFVRERAKGVQEGKLAALAPDGSRAPLLTP